MSKFIYAVGEESRDILLSGGYVMLKCDEKNNIYIFENKQSGRLNFSNMDYALSDVLTF